MPRVSFLGVPFDRHQRMHRYGLRAFDTAKAPDP
jgi:hypothetical protein